MTDRNLWRPMNPRRFAALADGFGGDLGRWPVMERQSARHLVAADPSLAKVLGDARRLDRMLDAAPAHSPSPELRERIIRAATRPRPGGTTWRWTTALGLGAGFAGAAAAGVALAIAVAPESLSRPHASPASADPVEEAAALLREPSDLGEV